MTLCDFNKLSSEILSLSWRRNVLQFAAAARIIGKKNREEGHAMICTCKTVTKKRTSAPSVSVFNSVSFDR